MAQQFHIVIARNAVRATRFAHRHHNVQNIDHARPSIHQIAHKNRLAILVTPHAAVIRRVFQFLPASFQFVAAAVNIADDIERPVFAFAIIPQRLAHNGCGVDFFGRQNPTVTKTVFSEIT